MKVFLSWSGELSHKVACAFREWLPSVIQAVAPYVSSEDIDKGTRWSTDIAKELEESSYGIICITKENLNAPWIHFEAGALSKSIDKSNVTPFLYNVKRSEVQGPLLQFQSTVFDKEDILKLLRSINARLKDAEKLKDESLGKALGVWWPQLEASLKALEAAAEKDGPQSKRAGKQPPDILEELLELVRNQQRLLASPEVLLPPDYLAYALDRVNAGGARDSRRSRMMDKLHDQIMELERLANDCKSDDPKMEQVMVAVGKLHGTFHDMMDRRDERRPRRVSEKSVLFPSEIVKG